MQSAPASVLIGVDQMNNVMNLSSAKKLPSGFTLLESRLGMVLSGRGETTLLNNQPVIDSLTVMTSTSQDPVEQFCKLELIGITENPTITDDDVAIQKFRQSIKFNDGRYYVRWPWKEGRQFSNNYPLCYRRLCSTIRSLQQKEELL
ncbi:unnamed protein product [Anisakis simplex]|uniref:DUF1758 domain-containing protein n=1 Tax=Anisakis simplex TaxID=6269 RepID=A0A0M3J7S6_ANISI|nr:unnamed protein product [Anisakis simplex]